MFQEFKSLEEARKHGYVEARVLKKQGLIVPDDAEAGAKIIRKRRDGTLLLCFIALYRLEI